MGKFHGGSFQAIQEYFQQKFCRHCSNPFRSEGITLLREEPGVLVVRVTCNACGHPLGVAIVGTTPQSKRHAVRQHPPEWTRRDAERLGGKPAINYDDVLAAHQFIDSMEADWTKYLPKQGGK